MHESSLVISKKAIQASLSGNWDLAIELNNQILEKSPNNIDAKIRLGRAYLVKKDFVKAKKLFEEVLKVDPINNIAKKNLEIAKQKKIDQPVKTANAKSLLRTPGTSTQSNINITNRKINCDSFVPGEELILKIKKTSVDVMKDEKSVIGQIELKELINKLNQAKSDNILVTVNFVKCKNNVCTIIIRANSPIFKAEKIDIRPYFKKGSIEEPELEIETGPQSEEE